MPKPKRLVPDWLIQATWFVAGIYATGALWYFLSKDEYIGAGLSAFGAGVLAAIAIYLHRVNDKSARQRRLREDLAGFLEEIKAVRERSSDIPPPEAEYSEWVNKVARYLSSELDASYATRFGDFTGMTFYTSNPNSGLKQDLAGRTQRLHEFIVELGDTR